MRKESEDRDSRHGHGESMGHERGFGMANGGEGGFDRDPHRVDVRGFNGRSEGAVPGSGTCTPAESTYGSAAGPRRTLERPEALRDFHGRTSAHGVPRADRTRASYRGRLPKSYTRSDERIREDVCEQLGMELDASEVEVRVEGGVVSLTGSVIDRATKYRLETITEHVLGVGDVQSHVTILHGEGNSLASTQRMDVRHEDGTPQSRH